MTTIHEEEARRRATESGRGTGEFWGNGDPIPAHGNHTHGIGGIGTLGCIQPFDPNQWIPGIRPGKARLSIPEFEALRTAARGNDLAYEAFTHLLHFIEIKVEP